jgi:4-amino-4-deoxy-L-arabinose transferase-like glycosyltransferase
MEQNNYQTDPPPAPKYRWLVFISVFLIILGQILLYATPINYEVVFPKAMWLTILGVFLFLASIALPKLSPKINSKFIWKPNQTQAWVLAGLCFSILATTASVYFERASLRNYIPVVTLWLFGGLCYVLAFAKSLWTRKQLLDWLSRHKVEIISLSLVTLLGAVLRFYKLGSIPAVINGDEARIGIIALGSYEADGANPFSSWENIGRLYLHAINFGIELFGENPLGLRLIPAIAGVLAIPAIYLLARQIAGNRIALIAAAAMAFTHTHLHFSRTVAVSYIQGTWLTPLALYFLLSGLQRKSSWRTALAGCLIAIHVAIYLDAQITIGICLAYTIVMMILAKGWLKTIWKQVLAFWGGMAIMLAPTVTFFLGYPNEFFNRLNAGGTFQSGWLVEEVILTGQSEIQILAGRVIHAFLSLIYYPAFDFYGSPSPILSLVSSSLFLVGLAVALWRTRKQGDLLLNGYFWGGVVAIGMFSIPPSADSYRVLISLPAALIMLAIGLDYLIENLGIHWEPNKKTYIAVASVVMFSLFIFNAWSYYVEFAGRCL